MKSQEQIEFDSVFIAAQRRAKDRLNECFYPNCTRKAINSHILQKNGILTPLIVDKHVMQPEVNFYQGKVNEFKRRGYKKAFSFPCFCNIHDSILFKPIENHPIDFSMYSNRLLFLIRAKYNEYYRKIVARDQLTELIKFCEDKGDNVKKQRFEQMKEQEELGIKDIQSVSSIFWGDLDNCTESFIIETRDICFIPICIASFFDYESSIEIYKHYQLTGKHLEELSSIFISVFPYEKESKLIIAYKKKNELKVKGYVNTFLKENEKKLQTRLTNLLSFHCETWITSESFYNQRIKPCEIFFEKAARFKLYNERQIFKLNLFNKQFCSQVGDWMRKELPALLGL